MKYKGSLSDCCSTSAGVPQGTKLGPVVFMALVNDAAVNENSVPGANDICVNHFKYVDDLTFVETRPARSQSTLLSELTQLQEWSATNNMRLNLQKCSTMDVCFCRNQVGWVVLTLQDASLQRSETLKLLGVFIQSDLKWNTHVQYMVKRANSRLYVLRTLKHHSLSVQDLIVVYTSFIRPVVEYAVPVWSGGLTKQQVKTIEQVQKRALRIILGAEYYSYRSASLQSKLVSLEDRRVKLCLSFAKSMQLSSCKLHHLLPKSRPCNYQTRNAIATVELRCRTTRFRNSPVPSLIRHLNTNRIDYKE